MQLKKKSIDFINLCATFCISEIYKNKKIKVKTFSIINNAQTPTGIDKNYILKIYNLKLLKLIFLIFQ